MSLDRVPDLTSLRLFVAVVETGSIGAGARSVGITQQSASDRLRGVEAQVGAALLRRSRQGSVPTEAGVVLAGWAARLLDAAAEVAEGIATLRAGSAARLRVASSMTIAEHLVPRWLLVLRRRATSAGAVPPAVELTATNSVHVLAAVERGDVDLGFVEGPSVPRGLRSRPLAEDHLVVVVAPGHPWTRRRRPVTPRELAATALVSREAGSGTREVLENALAAAGLRAGPPAVELTTATSVREAVRAGTGVAVLSRLAVTDDLDAGRLRAVPVEGLDLGRTLRAVWAGPARLPPGPARDLLGVAAAER
ncbi:DNA-binding transcriptional LysR family regulator [Kineococcus radiotolerans]|uniref:DNA-binding transcriptional LysR family regulator n=1 Tax=Kineococcus radiotolerans TaxID=131568 RepID=A0A7W4TNC2_KINRA|nr:LysR family transcriptional regulator [Kineococcus radiotolerans]MBB2902084.1 DNA-binding transcriptional LysR family regulator [Kineococcus radiotolerans]